LDEMLPPGIEMIHGPGCPVCVTPSETIDRAIAIAGRPGAMLCSFGDMLRVPGSRGDLFTARAAGGDVRMVASPLDAVQLARRHPDRQVVFLAIGFETTAPATALAAIVARREKLPNFSLLVAHVLVPPAIEAIMQMPGCRVQAFLAAGHVCSVMGTRQYGPLAARWRVPIVVTGFEPLEIVAGIRSAVLQLEAGRHDLENAYPRAVTEGGNEAAQGMLREVFEDCDRGWRGLGTIPASGWRLRPEYRGFDAEERFGGGAATPSAATGCRSGEVLTGRLKPCECAAFAAACTPRTPLGPTMVSAEGACAAYFHAGRRPVAAGLP
jgi:hydrogenase expression/formation protein HypD